MPIGYKIVQAFEEGNPYRLHLCSLALNENVIHYTYEMENPTVYKSDDFFVKCDSPTTNKFCKILPVFGKLFCFDSIANTSKYLIHHGLFCQIIYILIGEMENPEEIKRIALYREHYMGFWNCKKRKKLFDYPTQIAPEGTLVCDSFFPQSLYTAEEFRQQFVIMD